ncbi:MAG: hypothetical protein IKB15_07455 [Alistipes sp.]|nr:hypothetical protein [Alistipes sp.]
MTTILDRVYPAGIISDIVAQHLRIPEDAEVLHANACMCVRNAFDVAEAYTNRIIVDSLVTFHFEEVDTRIELPTAPVKEVEEVRYRHTDGEWRTLDSSAYQLVSDAHRAYIIISEQLAFATNQGPRIEVSVRCGYDEDGDYALPGSIRQAVMLMAGTFNSFEGDAQVGSVAELPMSARYLLSHYRILPYGG